MNKAYLELIGVQVVHCKPLKSYRIENVYARRCNGRYEGFATMKGYDMTLILPFKVVVQNLTDAYAPVIKCIWVQADAATESYYLQFVVCFRPSYIGLEGRWTHWAQL